MITLFSETARHKRSQVAGFCFCEMSRIGKSKQTETRLAVAGGRGWEFGSNDLMGMGFPFALMKHFGTT